MLNQTWNALMNFFCTWQDDALDAEQQKEMIPQVSRQCLLIQLHVKDERKEFEE